MQGVLAAQEGRAGQVVPAGPEELVVLGGRVGRAAREALVALAVRAAQVDQVAWAASAAPVARVHPEA